MSSETPENVLREFVTGFIAEPVMLAALDALMRERDEARAALDDAAGEILARGDRLRAYEDALRKLKGLATPPISGTARYVLKVVDAALAETSVEGEATYVSRTEGTAADGPGEHARGENVTGSPSTPSRCPTCGMPEVIGVDAYRKDTGPWHTKTTEGEPKRVITNGYVCPACGQDVLMGTTEGDG